MTTSAVVLTFFFIHIGVILVASAYYVFGAAIAPSLTDRARTRFEHRPWLAALIGLTVSVPWVGIGLLLANLPSATMKFAGAVLLGLFVLVGLLGGAAIAQVVGRAGTSASNTNNDPATWVHSLRGGLFLTLTWILPLVGWLGMMPLTLATGVGCFFLGLLPTKKVAQPTPQVAPPLPDPAVA